jgi:hypothetical protein
VFCLGACIVTTPTAAAPTVSPSAAPAEPTAAPTTALCSNNGGWADVDTGCNDAFPYCTNEDGTEISASHFVDGAKCMKCFNHYDDDTSKDAGCTIDAPICEAKYKSHGYECSPAPARVPCWNDHVGGEKDKNCDDNMPVCFGAPGFDAPGTECVTCVNTLEPNYPSVGWTDEGCPIAAPKCNGVIGGVGTKCEN